MRTRDDRKLETERVGGSSGRRRIPGPISRHPGRFAIVVVVGLVILVAAALWFEPWQIVVDESVNEALPQAEAPAEAGQADAPSASDPEPAGANGDADPDQGSSGPAMLSEGSFRSLEHETSGQARILELEDGQTFVRLEDFRTSNGPDLVVLLSDTPASEDSWGAYDDGRTVLLGELKGNIGNQNYVVPADVDPSRFDSVVIWCRRFTVGFGAAPIES